MVKEWLKKHLTAIILISTSVAFFAYAYGCQPRVRSLVDDGKRVTRQELQLEMDQLVGLAELRLLDLDRQEKLRAVILQNALVLVQGQPFNPVGMITAVAAAYGITQGGYSVGKTVKKAKEKRKVSNG